MCSEGVSVWFACKLCKSFFLNADDFAYHKKKSHVQEFRNTKFIVFEEQTSPTASPPENWVSFLSPKEETHIRKIISSAPSPPTTTNLFYKPRNENIQSNRNNELVEIDFDSNKVVIFNSHDNGSDAENDVTNNCLALNDDFNSYSDVSVLQNQLLQSSVEPASTGCDLADEKRVRHCSALIKPTFKSKSYSLKNTKQNKRNPVPSSSNVSQTVIQSPHNPYVYLKRLNLITIQNALPNSNSTAHSHENNRNHVDTSAEPANEPEVTHGNQHKFCKSYSTVISPPLITKATTFGNCKHCSQNCESASELYVHEQICHLKRQCENIVCIPCHLTFDSSDNLNAHNGTQHSTFISTATPETTKAHRTELANNLEVAPIKQIQSDFVSSIYSHSSSETNLLPLSINHDNDVYKTDCIADLELDPVSKINEFNDIPDPTTEVSLNYGDLIEVVKTEYVADTNEDIEFPGVNQDPFESESRDVALAEEMLILADNLDETQTSQIGFYCASGKIHFIHVREIKEHNKTHHVTPEGKKQFGCPYPNCETTSSSHGYIKIHLKYGHSDGRLFKCPYLNCKMSFKTSSDRSDHLQLHAMDESRREFECPYPDCGKRTSRYWNLQRHIQHVHSNRRPFKCPHPNCTRSFKVSGGMKRHLKSCAK